MGDRKEKGRPVWTPPWDCWLVRVDLGFAEAVVLVVVGVGEGGVGGQGVGGEFVEDGFEDRKSVV